MNDKLTKEQRKLLVGWAAEGLTLGEVNDRASKENPPFKVEWHALKWVRQKADKTYGEIKQEFERDALNEGLARRAVRIRQLQDLFDRHIALIKARGEEMDGEIAGGDTGLMVRDYKGKNADTPVYKYDAALIREMRGLFDDIARELGDRKTNVDLDVTSAGKPLLDPLASALDKAYGNGTSQPTETD